MGSIIHSICSILIPMEHKYTIKQKRCAFCGRFFRPNIHVGNRQISCKRPECQKKRRQAQQQKWRKTNPGYFQGRYEYLKQWRSVNPNYQKRWRASKPEKMTREIQTLVPHVRPIKSIRLNMRDNLCTGEIQTLVLTLIKSGRALWLTEARMQPAPAP